MMAGQGSLQKRDITFDIMKGIGILLVITAHFFSWNHPLLGRSITSFHMPMFFMVAGYFSKPFISRQDAFAQIKKYARRLLPAFAFTQITIILWAILMALAKDDGWNPVIRESLSLLWADPHGPNTPWGSLTLGVIWFLVALLIAKSGLLLLARLKGWAIPVSILLSVGALLLHRAFPFSIWCISLGLTALPFVTFGWWLRNHRIPMWAILFCILCWILAILYSHLGMYDMDWGCYPLDLLGACGGTFCLFYVSKFIGKNFRVLPQAFALLGIWSLAIMCFHDLEMHCHLGNHVMAFFPFSLPIWIRFVFRYFLTIAMAFVAIHTPILKRIFV